MTRPNDNVDAIVRKIRELPPLPRAMQELLRVVNSESSSASDVTRILSADPALTGKILKLANSSFYGFSGQVATVTRAVVVLGFSTIRSLALGLSACEAIRKIAGRVDVEAFWSHATCAAAAGVVLAEATDYREPEEAFVAGLLHDIGQLLIQCALPEEYGELLATRPADLSAAEKRVLGMSHARVGEKLARRWCLPEIHLEALRFHHAPQIAASGEAPLVSMIAAADVLSRVEGRATEPGASLSQATATAAALQLSLPRLAGLLPGLAQEMEKALVFLKIAGGEDHALPATASGPALTVAVLASQPDRAAWLAGVLAHQGHRLVAIKDYLAGAAEAGAVQLALLDPVGLDPEMARRLGPFLARTAAAVAVLDEGDAAPPPGDLGKHRRVPAVFTSADLTALAGRAPARQSS